MSANILPLSISSGDGNLLSVIKREIEDEDSNSIEFGDVGLDISNIKIEPLNGVAGEDLEDEDMDVLRQQQYPFLATVLRPKVIPAKHHEAKYEECNICGKTVKYLEKHLETHEGVIPEECPVCGKKVKHLDKHMEVHEEGVPVVKCTICGKKVKYLERHMEMHEDKRFACTYCRKVFNRKCYIQNHVREKHKGMPFTFLEVDKSFVEQRIKEEMNDPIRIATCTCNYCGTVCKTTKGLRNHLWMKHKKTTVLSEKTGPKIKTEVLIKQETVEECEVDTNFKCSFCGILCKLSHSLTVHLFNKHNKTPQENIEHAEKLANASNEVPDEIHQCTECGIICKTAKTLSNHQQYKHKNETFICHHCGKTFACKPYLKLHIRLMHQPVKLIKCPQCEEYFKRKSSLSRHMKTHLPKSQRRDKQFPCEHCPEYFTTKRDLLEHIKVTHKALNCFMCDDVFFNKVDFGKHVITHKEYEEQVAQRPYACDICGKRFQIESYCKSHKILQHTNDGNTNKCEVCSKEFLNATLLKKHKRNHARKYKCHICNVTCLRRAKLDKHIAIHMVDTQFKCKYCNSSFQARVALHSHLRWHASQANKPNASKFDNDGSSEDSQLDGTLQNNSNDIQHEIFSNLSSSDSASQSIDNSSISQNPNDITSILHEDMKNTELLKKALESSSNFSNTLASNAHGQEAGNGSDIKIKQEKLEPDSRNIIPHKSTLGIEHAPPLIPTSERRMFQKAGDFSNKAHGLEAENGSDVRIKQERLESDSRDIIPHEIADCSLHIPSLVAISQSRMFQKVGETAERPLFNSMNLQAITGGQTPQRVTFIKQEPCVPDTDGNEYTAL